MKKNTASQAVGAQMCSATDGSAFTSAVTVYVTGDAGTQAVGSVGAGACTHEGNGYHTYAPAQAETNYDLIAFTFIGTGAIPATVQVFTTFPQTGDNFVRLGAPAGASVSADIAAAKVDTAAIKVKTDYLPSATAGAAGGLFIAGSNAATSITTALTANITGNVSGSVGSVTGAVGSVTARVTANADQLAGQTVTAAAGVTFPTSVASPTNITAGTITTTTNLTNLPAITANWLTAAGIADGAIDRAAFAADTGLQAVRSNTAQAGAATTITLDASASAVTDFYKNDLIVLTGGTGVGQGRYITAYNGATKVATVTAWATNPDATTTFAVIAADAIVGATAPTAAQVADEVQTRTIAAVSLVNGLAANVITAAATAADFTTEIQSGLATAAALTVVDDFLDTEIAAIKAKTDSLTFTVAGVVDANVQSINDVTITGNGSPGTEFGV